ncbi:2-dehydropantoate 2-reductase [Hoeflea sp. G2-23]|uniref:2-dehydropantoate 2-reductase n=1 Tax=Hoeflea algicola TaxID=2983763 RepID=A0ABT3Z8R8_9HYPH|nr:2-dehydropantoate 2-reductase [Hoeflea algicola]MCY0148177.1 2-dehydropantoate 2-reductase [Hoeflea algicola]
MTQGYDFTHPAKPSFQGEKQVPLTGLWFAFMDFLVNRLANYKFEVLNMKVAVMGAGGVGGFYGAKLAEAGHDVSFIARGAHLEAIREKGLLIENITDGTSQKYDVMATEKPADIGKVDFLLFAVKMWDMEAAIETVKVVVGDNTSILSLQNGVIKDIILKQRFDEKAVLGGVGYVATAITRPGVVGQTGDLQKITIGEYDQSVSDRVRTIVASFASTGIEAKASSDIEKVLWEKYVFLVGLSAATAATRLPIGILRKTPETRQLLRQIIAEAVAVGRARGVHLPEDYADDRMRFVDTLPDAMKASMLHDLEAGKPMELRWLSGGIVDLGREVGVPTPANEFILAVLAPLAEGPAAA